LETKEEAAPWVSPTTEGRQRQKMDIPERTKFLTKKKEVLETPLAKWNKGATIEPEAPPLSDTSFGERGNGATPPPQIKPQTLGAAGRLTTLVDQPNATSNPPAPAVAQQLGEASTNAGISSTPAPCATAVDNNENADGGLLSQLGKLNFFMASVPAQGANKSKPSA